MFTTPDVWGIFRYFTADLRTVHSLRNRSADENEFSGRGLQLSPLDVFVIGELTDVVDTYFSSPYAAEALALMVRVYLFTFSPIREGRGT